MTNTIAIDTGDSRSILNLINEMESKDLGMVTGKNDKNEDMLVQLVVDEDVKLKIVVMQEDGNNRINYFNKEGFSSGEIYSRDDF